MMQIKYFAKLGRNECRTASFIEQGWWSYMFLGLVEQTKTTHPQK